jgi:hypothetical protein
MALSDREPGFDLTHYDAESGISVVENETISREFSSSW